MGNLEKIFERAQKVNPVLGEPANCIGTALFLVGLTDEDSCRKDFEKIYEDYIKNLTELENPELGCLISWEKQKRLYLPKNKEKKNIKLDPELVHLGVVTFLNPLRLIHRQGTQYEGRNERVFESYFEDIDRFYGELSDFIKYYKID